MTDEDKLERRDAYRLEHVEQDGTAVPIAVFFSAREALNIIPSLNEGYRLTLGDRQVWPNEASFRLHDGDTN
ncbi:hypothetical protein RFM99_10925 [Mesorhizobium sp. VK4C]|uniref:hypothetical protein n=1 Tax=Mesorhizobium captivum TaxID=3072319 RepID=UPI002A241B15|nr:hypothetical protein [Mesorhizobium sp. VK4C]MDX8498935.1 hypothetical protein [Mesorhizobium sp. VK4C]